MKSISFYDIDWALFNEVIEGIEKESDNISEMVDLYQDEFSECPTRKKYKELRSELIELGKALERERLMKDVYDFLYDKFWEV